MEPRKSINVLLVGTRNDLIGFREEIISKYQDKCCNPCQFQSPDFDHEVRLSIFDMPDVQLYIYSLLIKDNQNVSSYKSFLSEQNINLNIFLNETSEHKKEIEDLMNMNKCFSMNYHLSPSHSRSLTDISPVQCCENILMMINRGNHFKVHNNVLTKHNNKWILFTLGLQDPNSLVSALPKDTFKIIVNYGLFFKPEPIYRMAQPTPPSFLEKVQQKVKGFLLS